MRTIVDLPDEQVAAVAKLCAREGISRAEAVRRALDQFLALQAPGELEKAYGAWRGRKLKSREQVRKLRAEWGQ